MRRSQVRRARRPSTPPSRCTQASDGPIGRPSCCSCARQLQECRSGLPIPSVERVTPRCVPPRNAGLVTSTGTSVTVDDSAESRTRQPARKSDRIGHSCAQAARLGSGENRVSAWRPTVCRVIVPPQERPLAAGTATFAVATLRFVTTTSRGAFFRGIIGRPRTPGRCRSRPRPSGTSAIPEP